MFTIGCDPEFFLMDKKGNFVPAFDTVGGTKKEPRVLECGHTVQEDGCAVEIGIRPATTADEFVTYVREAVDEVRSLVKKMGLKIAIVNEATFDMDQLRDPRGWEVGCDPDFDAYTGGKRIMRDYQDTTRYAGGHIHIGSPQLMNPKIISNYIKTLDVVMGYKLNLMDKTHGRNAVYGGPGKFRFKPYGVEYRSPSNGWIGKPAVQRKIFEIAEKALYYVVDGNDRYARHAHHKHNYLNDAFIKGSKEASFDILCKEWW